MYQHWTEIQLPDKTIWRENFIGGTYAEYYPKKGGAFGTALGFLHGSFGSGPRIWLVRLLAPDGTFLESFHSSKEEAERKLLSEFSALDPTKESEPQT